MGSKKKKEKVDDKNTVEDMQLIKENCKIIESDSQ